MRTEQEERNGHHGGEIFDRQYQEARGDLNKAR